MTRWFGGIAAATAFAALLLACPVPERPDVDADGSPYPEDCAPSDPAIHPGAADPWGDDIDANCDGSDGTDADGDGWPMDSDTEMAPPDCDDSDLHVWPGAREASPHDGIDSDCSGGDGSGLIWADVAISSYTSFGLGTFLAGLGDIDGDGLVEVAIGQEQADDTGTIAGRVGVFFGSTLADGGTFSFDDADVALLAEGAWAHVGASVAGGGDFDGDGLGDLLVGAPLWGEQAGEYGAVYVVRGADLLAGGTLSLGDAWASVDASVEDQELGAAVAWAGDVDGDGLDDALMGAPATNGEIPGAKVGLFLGKTLANGGQFDLFAADVLVDRADPPGCVIGRLGSALTGLGDVDGDGRDDLAIGGSSRVGVFYSSSLPEHGVVLDTAADVCLQTSMPEGFGHSLAGGADLDGDCLPDLLVGEPGESGDTETPGMAHIVSGADLAVPGSYQVCGGLPCGGASVIGALLLGEHPASWFGGSVSLGDGDGDGRKDVAISASGYSAGAGPTHFGRSYVLPASALPIEGQEAMVTATVAWEGSATRSATWAGDINGDGREDLLCFNFGAEQGSGASVLAVFSGGLP